VVRGPSGSRRRGAVEAHLAQIELLDKGLHHTHQVVFGDVVVQTLRQQGNLASVLAFDESLHVAASKKSLSSI